MALRLGGLEPLGENAFSLRTKERVIDLGDFVLRRSGLSVSGVVVDVMGYPIADKTVSLKGPEQVPQEVSTDKSGHFQFDDLSDGEVEIATEVFTNRGQDMILGKAQAGDEGVVIVLPPKVREPKYEVWKPNPDFSGGVLEISVVDALTGEVPALRDVSVGITQEKGNRFWVDIDREGIARACVGAGKHQLTAGKYPVYKYKRSEVDVAAGQVKRVSLSIEPQQSVSGRVVDGEGQAVVGARVDIGPSGDRGETIADGSFVVRWDEEEAKSKGYKYYVRVVDKRSGLCAMAEIGPDGDVGEVVLSETSIIDVRVVDDEGQEKRSFVSLNLKGPKVYLSIAGKRISPGHYVFKNVLAPCAGYSYVIEAQNIWPRPPKVIIKPGEISPGEVKNIEILSSK